MKDVRSLLAAADPLRREPELTETDAARMRGVIQGATYQPPASPRLWPGAFALAAVIVLTVIAGTLGDRNLSTRHVTPRVETTVAAPVGADRRQVQFATPGGTRIIWTLDPEFQLREVMP